MSRAVSLSSVGLSYVVTDESEPDVTVVRYLNNFHVCQRSRLNREWKEIIADTRDMLLAKMIAGQLSLMHEAGFVTTELASQRPCRATAAARQVSKKKKNSGQR